MNGAEFLDRINEVQPGVKRILVSAFEMNDELFHNCHSIDTFLLKPVTMSELINVVQNKIPVRKILLGELIV